MLDKATRRKIESCKALQGKTVADLVSTDRFEKNLGAYLTAQKEDRKTSRKSYEAMKKAGGAIGLKLPAHPVDNFLEMSVADFAMEYLSVFAGTSKRPKSERDYVNQLGQQALDLTIAQIVCEEFPELEPALMPKSDN